MGKYFGTDGFRGEVNKVLTVEHAYKIGRFIGWYYGRDHKANIVIGKDTRRSGYMLEHALIAGITASGADAYMLHVTTTPSVSYITRIDDFDCGIMISASHNPFYDNGIKLINGNGEKMEDEVQDLCEKYLDGEMEELPLAERENIGKAIDYAAGRNRYIGYLISLATHSYKHMRAWTLPTAPPGRSPRACSTPWVPIPTWWATRRTVSTSTRTAAPPISRTCRSL